jgi:mannose-6-phosphate isomerase-like protein (cupin superfamily)
VTRPDGPSPAVVDLDQLLGEPADHPGVHWSHAGGDLNVNVVRLPAGAVIDDHVNDEVDVLVVVVGGFGTATVDDEVIPLGPRSLVVIPAGTTRAIAAGASGLDYLTGHRARGPLGIGRRQRSQAPPPPA